MSGRSSSAVTSLERSGARFHSRYGISVQHHPSRRGWHPHSQEQEAQHLDEREWTTTGLFSPNRSAEGGQEVEELPERLKTRRREPGRGDEIYPSDKRAPTGYATHSSGRASLSRRSSYRPSPLGSRTPMSCRFCPLMQMSMQTPHGHEDGVINGPHYGPYAHASCRAFSQISDTDLTEEPPSLHLATCSMQACM